MINRNKLQEDMADYLINKGNLALLWSTSMGKSLVAIKAFNKNIDLNKESKFLIVVAETAHKDNWKREFIKFLGKERTNTILANTTIICYASLKNYRNTYWDIICFDEAHHLQSDLRKDIITDITANRVLALSATIGDTVLNTLKETYGEFNINRVSLQKAIDSKFLAKPTIHCISLTLDNSVNTVTVELNSKNKNIIKDRWYNRWEYFKNRKKYKNYKIILSCTEKEKYDYLTEQFEYYKKLYFQNSDNESIKNKWLQAGNNRKKYLGELKTKEALKLVNRLRVEKKRFICFCNSISQAEALGSNNAVHSKNSNSCKVIDSFNNKSISEIFAIGMLVEGVSLTDIQVGVMIQLDGKERQFIQKIGRIFRSNKPIQYIFYYKNTKDEEYFNNVIEDINEDYVIYEDNN